MSANSSSDSNGSGTLSFGKFDRAEDIMLRQAAAIARLGFFVVDVTRNKVETCSVRHAEIFGLTPDQYIARATGLQGELTMVHPDDRDYLRASYERLHAGEQIELEYRFRRADGSWGHICEHVAPELDGQGNVVRALGSSRDVTEARLRDAQELQSERLETLGVLTAGVAHDFNNILAVVMGNAQLGQAHTPTVLMHEILEEIVEAAQRGARLTKSLLAFAQRATMVPRVIGLNKAVERAVREFERANMGDVSLSVCLADDDPSLLVDADQLQIVLLNILTNAAEASAKGASVQVNVSRQTRPDEPVNNCSDPTEDNSFCVVSIQDTGAGIPAEFVQRVTEPFFTTKNRAKGSGLGLSMAHGFAKQSGGVLTIESREGEGTTVTLFLPMTQAQAIVPDTPVRSQKSEPEKNILLLEDDTAVSDVVSRQLTTAGYSVMAAHRPEDAFELLNKHSFDIAVFDNILPGDMNGVDVARTLRQKGDRIPIILLTGLPSFLSDQHLSNVDALLHKPVPIQTLLKQIELCLSEVV